MKVSELLEKRRDNWRELERLCDSMQKTFSSDPAAVRRFSDLYRSAIADLALAEAFHLPPATVQYLNQLVGRARNRLYRSRRFALAPWGKMFLFDVPQQIFRDPCVHLAFALFWGIFLLGAWLAWSDVWPGFTKSMLSAAGMESLRDMYQHRIDDPERARDASINFLMAGFYISHNTTIGLQSFVGGLLIIPGIYITCYNAAVLGASFGFMATDPVAGPNFFHFVTAHGPFELTAIALSAGAGLRLGVSWLMRDPSETPAPETTNWGVPFLPGVIGKPLGHWIDSLSMRINFARLTRGAALKEAARKALPMMGAAVVLFFLAALTEGFLSPSLAPYVVKAAFAIVSSGLIMFYFVILGFPRDILGMN